MEKQPLENPPRMRNVLMLAYVFPPFFSVGGSIRVVKFIKYLPAHAWTPMVLTIDDKKETASQRKEGSEYLLAEIPSQVRIFRTSSGETSAETLNKGRAIRQKNHLAGMLINTLSKTRQWFRKYLLIPDVNITWLPHAVKMGRRIIVEEKIDVIFATCPPHSVILMGTLLKKFTGKPLVLDYRDDWIDTPWFYTKPAWQRMLERLLEKWIISNADRVILVTEASRDSFLKRYPQLPPEKFVFIPNGVDLADFPSAEEMPFHVPNNGFNILHSGIVLESETWNRNPRSFFTAINNLFEIDPEFASKLQISFTGKLKPGILNMIEEMHLSGIVKELGHLPREELSRQLMQADLLLAINYEGFSTLIPGKIYDYWAAGNAPILLLSSPGAASSLLKKYQLGSTVELTDVSGIESAVMNFYKAHKAGRPLRISRDGIERYSRKFLAGQLAELLNETVLNARGKT